MKEIHKYKIEFLANLKSVLTFLMMSLMATSFPFSVPTNSSSCSTVSTAVFLWKWFSHFSNAKERHYKTTKVRRSTCRLIPVSDVDRHQVVEVQAAPLLNIRRAGGTVESPAHLWTRAGQKNCGELLPEARLTALEKLIGLVDDQPFHTEHQQKTSILHFFSKCLSGCLYVTRDRDMERRQSCTTKQD